MKNLCKVSRIALLALIIAIALPCCKTKTQKAQQALTEFVAGLKFPQAITDNISIVDCSYTDNTLTIKYGVDKPTYKKINAEASSSKALDRLRSELLPRSFAKKLIAAEASLKCVFVYESDSTSFSFTPEELED